MGNGQRQQKIFAAALLTACCAALTCQQAQGVASIALSGHSSALLQISLNGSAYNDSVTDVIELSPQDEAGKTSVVSVRTNMMKWSLTAQTISDTSGASNGDDGASHLSVYAQPNQLQTVYVSQPLNLQSIKSQPKVLLTANQPTDNGGSQITLQYQTNGHIGGNSPLSVAVQYRVVAAP